MAESEDYQRPEPAFPTSGRQEWKQDTTWGEQPRGHASTDGMLKCRKQGDDGRKCKSRPVRDAPCWAHCLPNLADAGTTRSVGIHEGPGFRPFALGLEPKREVLTEQPSSDRR